MKAAYRLDVNGQKPGEPEGRSPTAYSGTSPELTVWTRPTSFKETRNSTSFAELDHTGILPRVPVTGIAHESKELPHAVTYPPENYSVMTLLIRGRQTILIYFRRQLLIRLCHNAML